MVAALAVYDSVLLAAIILLEWHYVMDILGGIFVAGLAIATMDGSELLRAMKIKKAPESLGRPS